jgi:site-specific DNA-methyltransferase (adenine-specific)
VPEPYYADDLVTLYLGDCREVLPALGVTAACIIADPPYGETSLAWDRWPSGWLDVAATVTRSLWCFGSLRLFLDRRDEFAGWRLSQDVIWEKPRTSLPVADRFMRCHETVTFWYRGDWRTIHHQPPLVDGHAPAKGPGGTGPQWGGGLGTRLADEGVTTRLMRSVLNVGNRWPGRTHPTEKPTGILEPLIDYACPPGGLVVDPFAGSGSTLDAARVSGRRAIGVEADERYAERAARRLSQGVLEVVNA